MVNHETRMLIDGKLVESDKDAFNGGLWYGADAPFGGYKQSGVGRQCGIEGLEIFTETKTVGWPAS
jgi:acyl-CoA reductase-like NAD-dependent aldehyde dehydrogenase